MTEPSQPDPALARFQSVNAEKRKFGAETEPLRPELFRYCRALTGSVWDAEDLVQDTLLRAFAIAGETYGGIRDLRAYLFRTATNVWIDQERRRAPLVISHEDLPETAIADAPALEVRDALAALARRLPPQERVAVLLKDVFDFPLLDIARSLGTTEGAVKAALHRGRSKLAQTGPRETAPASRGPSRQLVDAFAAAFTAKDVHRLIALMLPGGATDLVGVARDFPESPENGTFAHTVHEDDLVRGERRVHLGEPVLLLWYRGKDGGADVVGDVIRLDEAAGRCARLRYYYFCPDVLTEVCGELSVPFRTNGYHY